jgi:uncharacterized protein with HEPN domain
VPPRNWKARIEDILEVHEYFGVSHSILWQTIKNNFPPLVSKLKKTLDEE